MRLVRSALCRCRAEAETVDHVLYRCERLSEARERLREAVAGRDGLWPCDPAEFLGSRSNFYALVRFARTAITDKQDEDRAIRG